MGRGSSGARGGGGGAAAEKKLLAEMPGALPDKIVNVTAADIKTFFDAPEGTKFTVYSRDGKQYIGEYTKGEGRKWIGTQTRKSLYPKPETVAQPSRLRFEIGGTTIKFKK